MNKDSLLSFINKHYDPESKGVFKRVRERQSRRFNCLIDESPIMCCYAPLKEEFKLEPTWQESLFDLIDENDLDEVKVYKNAGLTKQTFSKIRSNRDYHPEKDTVIMLCFGLELSYNDSIEFLSKAGYTLSKSIRRDVITAYFLQNKIHDIYELDNTFEELKENRIIKIPNKKSL